MTFKYEALSPEGDSLWGCVAPQQAWLIDSPQAVGQAIQTRLGLWQGQYFLDRNAGTPWMQQILAQHSKPTADAAIRGVIVGTPFVLAISDYSSVFDPGTRALSISCKVTTAFGQLPLSATLPLSVPPQLPVTGLLPIPSGPFVLGPGPVTS